MDLLGLDVQARRREAKFTVLSRPGRAWSDFEVSRLVQCLKPMAIVHQHPQQPTALIVREEWTKEAIIQVIGNDHFQHKLVVGFENPELPFKVPSL